MPLTSSTDASEISPYSVIVGIGGNIGDTKAIFIAAIEQMRQIDQDLQVSHLYRSAPIGPAQADFLNAAVKLSYSGALSELLKKLQAIENAAARVRTQRWGPRTLDLDILWAAAQCSSTPELTVPHPELRARLFAIWPLLDLVPGAVDPHDGVSYHTVFHGFLERPVERISQERWWEALP